MDTIAAPPAPSLGDAPSPRPAAAGGVLQRLGTLGDENRTRILLILDRNEFSVSELCQILQLPQSTVSRHLKVLSEDGWVVSRAEGTSRHYRLRTPLDPTARGLWRPVREEARRWPLAREDGERADGVLTERKERSRAFFRTAAGAWDAMRAELFGTRTDLLALQGLLEPEWTVADLGCGTGAFAGMVAPFVRRVVAVDRSPEMLEAASARLHGVPGVELRQGELEALPLENGEVDLAMALLVLHYVVEPLQAIREMARVLKPGGRLVLLDMRAHGREEYRGEMGHAWMGFSREVLEGWLEEAGFAGARVTPLPPEPGVKGPLLFMARGRRERGR